MNTRKIGSILFFTGLLNFAIFGVASFGIGGDALSGRAENGRYYLSNHGTLTETTHAIFVYSQVHAISVCITHPLALFGGWLSTRSKRKKRKFKTNHEG